MSRLTAYLSAAAGTAANVLDKRTGDILYIVEKENWAVRQVGATLAGSLTPQGVAVQLATTARGCRGRLVHFGSIDTFITSTGKRRVQHSNRVIVTIYHVS